MKRDIMISALRAVRVRTFAEVKSAETRIQNRQSRDETVAAIRQQIEALDEAISLAGSRAGDEFFARSIEANKSIAANISIVAAKKRERSKIQEQTY